MATARSSPDGRGCDGLRQWSDRDGVWPPRARIRWPIRPTSRGDVRRPGVGAKRRTPLPPGAPKPSATRSRCRGRAAHELTFIRCAMAQPERGRLSHPPDCGAHCYGLIAISPLRPKHDLYGTTPGSRGATPSITYGRSTRRDAAGDGDEIAAGSDDWAAGCRARARARGSGGDMECGVGRATS